MFKVSVDSCEHSLTSLIFAETICFVSRICACYRFYIHKTRSLIPCSEDNIDADVIGKYNYKNGFSCLLKCLGPFAILCKVRICCKVCVHSC